MREYHETGKAVQSLVEALFRTFYAAGHRGFVEVRIIGPAGAQARFFSSVEQVVDALPGLANTNGQHREIYFGVNPRAHKCGREEDVEWVVAFHADWDAKNGGLLDPAELSKRTGIAASIIVASGHGLHPYWLLREPLGVTAPEARAAVRGVNAALAARLGADHCHDLGRVLRLPGFINWKKADQPVAVELKLCRSELRYRLADFDFLRPEPMPSAAGATRGGTGNDRGPELSECVKYLLETHAEFRERWHGNIQGLTDDTRSGRDWSLTLMMIIAEVPDDEIAAALELAPHNARKKLTRHYLKTTLLKAHEWLAEHKRDSAASAPRTAPNANAPAPARDVISLAEAKECIAKWLAFTPGEDLAVDVALAAKIANDAPGDPVFLVLIGPSSGAKTEIIRAFKGVPGVYSLGGLTARTFASGLDPKKASLLVRLPENTHILAVKDFGTILEMSPNERGELLQQLRDIFDGHLHREWGSGKGSLDWTGRLGLLAGATSALEREFSTLALLGERFVFFRVHIADREAQAKRAFEISGREDEMRAEIHTAIASVLCGIPGDSLQFVRISSASADVIEAIACCTTQARTPVIRNRFDRTLEVLPEPEGPARTTKALKKFCAALAVLYGHAEVGSPELTVLVKIGVDSLPTIRVQVLARLFSRLDDEWVQSRALAEALGLPTFTVTRILEDLASLRIVARQGVGERENAPYIVRLKPKFRSLLLRSAMGVALVHAHPCENAVGRDVPTAQSGGCAQPVGRKGDEYEGGPRDD